MELVVLVLTACQWGRRCARKACCRIGLGFEVGIGYLGHRECKWRFVMQVGLGEIGCVMTSWKEAYWTGVHRESWSV